MTTQTKVGTIGAGLISLLFIVLVIRGTSSPLINTYDINEINTMANLKTAVTTFYTDYRRMPVDSHEPFVDLRTDKAFMRHLSEESPLNPRGTVFFDGGTAQFSSEKQIWRNGVVSEGDRYGELVDRNGNYYRLRIRSLIDGELGLPSPETNETVAKHVLIWSAGKDGDFDTWKDNIKSWDY